LNINRQFSIFVKNLTLKKNIAYQNIGDLSKSADKIT
jgi:hypothetical protein